MCHLLDDFALLTATEAILRRGSALLQAGSRTSRPHACKSDEPLRWGEVDDDESIRAIHAGLDRGITFLETADVYGAGHSERIVGRAVADRSDRVVIATKFGFVFDESSRQVGGSDASPGYVRSACEASLSCLGTDYIDLYQFHLNDFDSERTAEVRDVLKGLVAEGKIRAYGWNADFEDRARIFAEGPSCVAIQHQMNVIDDAPEVVAVCEERELASINRGPLAMSLLTGKYKPDTRLADDDVRGQQAPGWMAYFKDGKPNPQWLKKVAELREILTADGRSLVHGAIGWLWGRSSNTIPIPGFRTVSQVDENARSLTFGRLSAAQMADVSSVMGR